MNCQNFGVSYLPEDTECRGCGRDLPEHHQDKSIRIMTEAAILDRDNKLINQGRKEMLNDVLDYFMNEYYYDHGIYIIETLKKKFGINE